MFAARWLDGLVLIALGVVVFSTLSPVIRGLRASGLSPAARFARRRAVVASTLAGLAAIAVVLLLINVPFGPRAEVTAAAPALIGAAMIAVAIVAERTWPRPSGQIRTATLRARRPGSGSRALSWMSAVSGGISVLLLIVARLTDAPGGRALLNTWNGDTVDNGPYPGSQYTWVVLGCLLLVGGLTALGLRVVDARPALGTGLEREDDAAREASRVRVLRGSAFATLSTTAGLTFAMTMSWMEALVAAKAGDPKAFDALGWGLVQPVGLSLYVAALALMILALKVFLTAGPSMPDARQTSDSPAALAPTREAAV